MSAKPRSTSTLRGHPIYLDGEDYRYVDNDEPTATTWTTRDCGHCYKRNTPEGHDGCLGTLPGVANACCGHGAVEEAYIQLHDGSELRGESALAVQQNLTEASGE